MLRCIRLGLDEKMLRRLSVGDIYDMLTEEANDHEEYPKKATQEDMDAFFR